MILSIIAGAVLLAMLIIMWTLLVRKSFNPYSTASRTEALEMEEDAVRKLNK